MKNINITLNDQTLFSKLRDRAIVGLFDFDTGFDQWNGVWKRKKPSVMASGSEAGGLLRKHPQNCGWAMLLPVPDFRATYASGALGGRSILSIEFLFADNDIPAHMIAYRDLALSAKQPYFPDALKADFAAHAKTLSPASFTAFEPLLKTLEDIVSGKL